MGVVFRGRYELYAVWLGAKGGVLSCGGVHVERLWNGCVRGAATCGW